MTQLIPFPPDSAWTSPTENTDLPYDFVQVALENGAAKDKPTAPVWHDGANSDQEELYSGELRCTLKTLSPLLVANQQVAINELTDEARCRVEKASDVPWTMLDRERERERRRLGDKLSHIQKRIRTHDRLIAERQGNLGVLRREVGALKKEERQLRNDLRTLQQRYANLLQKKSKKKLLFPLARGRKDPLLIPGESIKGMVRHALGALLSSPMERVRHETFSYRPNAQVAAATKTRACGAQVLDWDKNRLFLKIRLIENIAAIEFVHGERLEGPTGPIGTGVRLRRGEPISNKTRQNMAGGRYKWSHGGVGSPLEADCVYLGYHYALDQHRHFMDVAKKGPGSDHPGAFVPVAAIARTTIVVDPAVVRQYLDTFEHLSDGTGGHLSRNHDETVKTKVSWPDLAKNDLIFCEWLLPANGRSGQVISFGHNFRYRWKHLDSVTTVAAAFDGARWTPERRPELSAHPDERPRSAPPEAINAPQPPAALTAQRNLFGYIVVPPANQLENRYGALSTLRDPFSRLAGRVSLNIAMEQLNDGDNDETRFVNHDKGCFLFLHPAVSPKASFSRSYVPGRRRTWGDAVALNPLGAVQPVYALQNGTRAFAGRKFYLHQFKWNRQTKELALESQHYDLNTLLQTAGTDRSPTACGRWDVIEYLWSDQSALATHVSRAGRDFGWTLRFKDLRDWELAALTAALNPTKLANAILEQRASPSFLPRSRTHLQALQQSAAATDGPTLDHAFAHKLGHGKAMGMGSVQVTIDDCVFWRKPAPAPETPNGDAPISHLQGLIRDKLLARLDDASTLQWLKVLQVLPERAVRSYLLHQGNDGKPQDIVTWAQQERAQQMKHARVTGFG
jgi:hypothetical protein